jgi:hypothetical protein
MTNNIIASVYLASALLTLLYTVRLSAQVIEEIRCEEPRIDYMLTTPLGGSLGALAVALVSFVGAGLWPLFWAISILIRLVDGLRELR